MDQVVSTDCFIVKHRPQLAPWEGTGKFRLLEANGCLVHGPALALLGTGKDMLDVVALVSLAIRAKFGLGKG